MSRPNKSVSEIVRDLLLIDRSLLERKEDFLQELNAHKDEVPGAQMKDFRSLQKALLESNISEIFIVADKYDHIRKQEAIKRAENILRKNNIQENTIKRLIAIFVNGLDWNKTTQNSDKKEMVALRQSPNIDKKKSIDRHYVKKNDEINRKNSEVVSGQLEVDTNNDFKIASDKTHTVVNEKIQSLIRFIHEILEKKECKKNIFIMICIFLLPILIWQGIEAAKSTDERADEIVKSMSLQEKIGQMMIIGIQGTEIDNNIESMIGHYYIGGVILTNRNLENEKQTKKLNHDIQNIAKKSGQKVPLFIAIEEEGGNSVQGKAIINPPPSQHDLAVYDPNVTIDWSKKTSKRLKELGINVNFAPDANVGNNRYSYSEDSEKVAAYVKASAEGYEAHDEIYVLKYFPGIENESRNVRYPIHKITTDKEDLKADIEPFQNIIETTSSENFMIMVSHLKYTALDKNNSASQSKKVMTDLLRNELGYNGIIITDDATMGASANYDRISEFSIKAIKAGADIIFIDNSYMNDEQVYNALYTAVKTGEISEKQIDESVKRIIKTKLAHHL